MRCKRTLLILRATLNDCDVFFFFNSLSKIYENKADQFYAG